MPAASHPPIILASASEVRAQMLRNAGLGFEVMPGRIDEEAVRQSHLSEGGSPRDLADLLAEMKAQKISEKRPEALVIGADQVLECSGRVFAKPADRIEAAGHLSFLSGRGHRLLSAAVVCHGGRPLWRHVGQVRMAMHTLGPDFIHSYLDRNWETVRHSVGCYQIEGEGVRLFNRVEGDFFHILGLPLIELLTWLHNRGDIST
ncbi:MAG: Maf family protein [Proteobacteria bacterium]|nr:Maf family protein [Pseudomonadota bacterium]MBS0573273.1 Maf family protein [Pseudomonadota bacterium]